MEAAANLDGHLIAIAVDKRRKWLTIVNGDFDRIVSAFTLKASWNRRALEAMLRKTHFVGVILSMFALKMSNITWITDADEFVGNDIRHDDALASAARFDASDWWQMHGSNQLSVSCHL